MTKRVTVEPKEALPPVLVLDDDPLALSAIESILSPLYEVHCFTNAIAAESELERHRHALVILDLHLPGRNGLSLLNDWKAIYPEVEVVFCSAETQAARAIECLRQGASDYVVKPIQSEDLKLVVSRGIDKLQWKRQAEKLEPLICPEPYPFIAESPVMKEVLEKVAQLKGQFHLNVLILGESGTGKEGIARLLHQQDSPARPFVTVNTPAIPVTLIEAELFGVERGAYTDAKRSRPGKFELADGGDLFLDEIGDLSEEVQAKVLRALQDGSIERIGSQKPQKVDCRIVSATNRSLVELKQEGHFREDLFYRLNDVVISLPPLRERKEDIPALCDFFLEQYRFDRPKVTLSPEAMKTLIDYEWPGNVRELQSALKRTLAFQKEATLNHIDFGLQETRPRYEEAYSASAVSASYSDQVTEFERKVIETAIRRHHGNKRAAMAELKLPRATFYRKIHELNVQA